MGVPVNVPVIDLAGAGHVALERPDGERVTLQLPMDIRRVGRLFRVLGDEGFEFERVIPIEEGAPAQ